MYYVLFVRCTSTNAEKARYSLFYALVLFAVKEAKARPIPIGLPEHLKNYFENAMKKPQISNIFG